MLRFAGYNGRGNLLDPFCKSSTIPIEAALLSSGISHNFFRKDSFAFLRAPFLQKQDFKNFFSDVDSESKNFKSEIFAFDSLLKNIHASRKNAKIANINKRISFSKTPLENLDLKFDSDIDFIVSVPTLTNSFNHKSVSKEYNELFHQADLVLSAEGSLVLLILDPSLLKGLVQNYSLVLSNELVIMTGKQTSHMLLFNKR
jgi:23S rRNA G2445 N2-methylase RlmL